MHGATFPIAGLFLAACTSAPGDRLHGPAGRQRPGARLPLWAPRIPEIAIGGQGFHGGPHWVLGGTAAAAVETSPGDDLFARLHARGSYDDQAEGIDEERHALWCEGKLLFGLLPIDCGHGLRLGLRGDVTYVDNTPTSIERGHQVVGGLGGRWSGGGSSVALLVGGHNGTTELDDDLPRLRGFDRDSLESTHHGLAASTTLQHTFAVGVVVAVTSRILLDEAGTANEITYGAAIDVPLERLGGGVFECLRLSAEERFVDNDLREELPFLRDGFVRLELIAFFGPRSWRSYGW